MSEPVSAGRETDARVAAALGWTELDESSGRAPGTWRQWPGEPRPVPPFSTDDGAALEVVEHLRQRGWLVVLYILPAWCDYCGAGRSIAGRYLMQARPSGWNYRRLAEGEADTLALAVVRCALDAVGLEREVGDRRERVRGEGR